MPVHNFTSDLYAGCVSWSYNGKDYEKKFDELKDAAYYENENIILVLNGKNKLKRKLFGILPDSTVQFELEPPEGYCFYYLSSSGEDDNAEMAVACLDTTSARGFDIFFTIERRTHILIEQGRKH